MSQTAILAAVQCRGRYLDCFNPLIKSGLHRVVRSLVSRQLQGLSLQRVLTCASVSNAIDREPKMPPLEALTHRCPVREPASALSAIDHERLHRQAYAPFLIECWSVASLCCGQIVSRALVERSETLSCTGAAV